MDSHKIKVKINDNTPLGAQSAVGHREDLADTAKKDGSLVESHAAANSEKKLSSVLYPGGSSDPLQENLYASAVSRAHIPHNSSTALHFPLVTNRPDASSAFPTARADISGRIKPTSNLDTMSLNTFSPIELLTTEEVPQQNHIHSEFITQQNQLESRFPKD